MKRKSNEELTKLKQLSMAGLPDNPSDKGLSASQIKAKSWLGLKYLYELLDKYLTSIEDQLGLEEDESLKDILNEINRQLVVLNNAKVVANSGLDNSQQYEELGDISVGVAKYKVLTTQDVYQYLTPYATQDYVQGCIAQLDLDYVTPETLENALTDYVTFEDFEVALADYLKEEDLVSYATKQYVLDNIESSVSKVYKTKGSVAKYSNLPSNPKEGDVYDVLETGDNYVWVVENNVGRWDKLSGIVDLSSYYTKTEIGQLLNNKQDTIEVGTEMPSGVAGIEFAYLKIGGKYYKIPNPDLSAYYNKTEIDNKLATKVDAVSGKGLSSNDFTDEEKAKLGVVEENVIDEIKVNGTALQVTNKAVNINVPTRISTLTDDGNFVHKTGAESISGIKTFSDGIATSHWKHSQTIDNMVADESNIKVLKHLVPNASNQYNLGASGKEWNNFFLTGKIYSDSKEFVLPSTAGTLALLSQIPTKVSELVNDSGFINKNNIIVLKDNGSETAGVWLAKTSEITDIVEGQVFLYEITIAGASTTTLNINGLGAKTIYRYGTTKLSTQYGVGDYLLLYYNGTSFKLINDRDADTNTYVRQYQAGQNAAGTAPFYPILTRYSVSNKNGSYDATYARFHTDTKIDTSTGNLYAPKFYEDDVALENKYLGISSKASDSAKLNGQEATYYLNYNNLSNKPSIPTTLAALTGDATHRVVTDTEKSTWNGKQNALTFDNAPTSGSNNPVKSGGIYTAINDIKAIAEGKSVSLVTTISKMSSLNTQNDTVVVTSIVDQNGDTMSASDLKVGTTLYVTDVGVPDRWISAISGSNITLSKLETQKPAISAFKVNGTSVVDSNQTVDLTVDSTPTSGSSNFVTSGGVYSALSGKQATLTTAQLSAANSGITATKVNTYDGYASDISSLQDSIDSLGSAATHEHSEYINTATGVQRKAGGLVLGTTSSVSGEGQGKLFVAGVTTPALGLQASNGTQFLLQASADTLYLGTTTSLSLVFAANTGAITLPNNLTLTANGAGVVTANSFVKSGGTSSQFLKADGSTTTFTTAQNNALNSGITSTQVAAIAGIQSAVTGKQDSIDWNVTVPSGKTPIEVTTFFTEGEYYIIKSGGGTVTDVQVNGTSVISNGEANILTETAYDPDDNKIATMADIPSGEIDVVFNGTATSTTHTLTNIVVGSATYLMPKLYQHTIKVFKTYAGGYPTGCVYFSFLSESATAISTLFGLLTALKNAGYNMKKIPASGYYYFSSSNTSKHILAVYPNQGSSYLTAYYFDTSNRSEGSATLISASMSNYTIADSVIQIM